MVLVRVESLADNTKNNTSKQHFNIYGNVLNLSDVK